MQFAEAIPIIRKTWGLLMKDKENVGAKIYQYILNKEISMSKLVRYLPLHLSLHDLNWTLNDYLITPSVYGDEPQTAIRDVHGDDGQSREVLPCLQPLYHSMN